MSTEKKKYNSKSSALRIIAQALAFLLTFVVVLLATVYIMLQNSDRISAS